VFWKRFKPGVSKYWLLTLAGLMWAVVGVMLCRRAYGWFGMISWQGAIPFEIFGVLMALAAHRYGFSKIAARNIERLCLLTERTCVFAFQTWRGYLVVGLMIGLGYGLSHSPVPQQCRAVLYTMVGGALFLSSFSYFKLLWQRAAGKEPC